MARSKAPLLGSAVRKIQPKLRMIANGDQQVNEVRSDFSSAIRVAPAIALVPEPPHAQLIAVRQTTAPKPKSLKAVADKIEASVFVEMVSGWDSDEARVATAPRGKNSPLDIPLGHPTARRENLITATVSLNELAALAADESVARVELGEPLKAPTPIITADGVRAPSKSLRRFGSSGGRNVLIGVIDVGGFDFAHPDFLHAEGRATRFERIWDQGGRARPSPPKFGYGAEIRREHMDAALAASESEGLAPQLLERQSQLAPGSHGTHVASIAAGARGVCREAFLAGVLISLPEEDNDRRRSFYDSTRIAHAVDYLFELAEELRLQHGLDELPVSINISLGTNGHAHDGSSAVNRWIDSALSIPGRGVTVAAGNAGQEAAQSADDLGYVMGRIHTSGRIAARGLSVDVDWIVFGNGVDDVSENELEFWYSPADRFSVLIRPPGGEWIGPVRPGQFIENRQLAGGAFLSIYNELYHPANGDNYISIYLSPFLSETAIVGVPAGEWTVRLVGDEIRDGRYHAWIERDDPRRIGPLGSREAWRFPSFFSARSNVDDSSVSSLACGQRVISVANLDEAAQQINITSSQGPTRDGRTKPDVAAPGTDVVAANGFDFDDGEPWIAMSGTSMASPYVCGVVGLMLAAQPRLTAAQINGIIQRTAAPLPGADYTWRNDAGFGVIRPEECVREAASILDREDVT